MQNFNIFFPMEPVAKARARVTALGNYTPKKTKDAEKLIAWSLRDKYKDKPHSGPVSVKMEFYFRRPKARKKAINHVCKPDLTNLAKTVEDAANKILWDDDSQIISLQLDKYYVPYGQGGFIKMIVNFL